jgi:hypothetical protein
MTKDRQIKRGERESDITKPKEREREKERQIKRGERDIKMFTTCFFVFCSL